MRGATKAKDPNEPVLTHEDIAKWNGYSTVIYENCELIKQLQIELTIVDGAKIKSDITTLRKA